MSRLQMNFSQGLAGLAGLAVGALIGWVVSEESKGATLGGLIGLLAGILVSGVVLGAQPGPIPPDARRGPGTLDRISWILHVVVLITAAAFFLWMVVAMVEANADPDPARRGARLAFGFPLLVAAIISAVIALAAGAGLLKLHRARNRQLRIAAFAERFRPQPTEVLVAQQEQDGLTEEGATALQEVLREREAKTTSR